MITEKDLNFSPALNKKIMKLLNRLDNLTENEGQEGIKIMTEFYRYKGNTYLVLGRVYMKDSSGEWKEAYKYTDGTGKEFVREIRDFEQKFKRVNVIAEDPLPRLN